MNIFKSFLKQWYKSNELNLEYYELYVPDGITDTITCDFIKIIEVYIPELGISFNNLINPIYIFLSSKDRYITNIESISKYPPPKLIKSININKKTTIGKQLIWLAKCYKNKKDIELKIVELFNK